MRVGVAGRSRRGRCPARCPRCVSRNRRCADGTTRRADVASEVRGIGRMRGLR
jgi:hypothetical protein